MLDIKNSIRSLTEFKQNSSDILKYINATHNPAILTVNGKAEVVLLNPESYQEMSNKIALFESAIEIKAALMEMEGDEGIVVQKVFKKLRQKFVKNEKI